MRLTAPFLNFICPNAVHRHRNGTDRSGKTDASVVREGLIVDKERTETAKRDAMRKCGSERV